MSLLDQAREGWQRIINENPITLTIERKPLKPDGYDGFVPDPYGTSSLIPVRARISHESKVSDGPGPGGIAENQGRFISVDHTTIIYREDVFEAYGSRWKIGPVDRNEMYGGVVGFRAPLIQITQSEVNT